MLCFNGDASVYGNYCIMRILFDYQYDKYLGAFRFVLVSRNNEVIVCVH